MSLNSRIHIAQITWMPALLLCFLTISISAFGASAAIAQSSESKVSKMQSTTVPGAVKAYLDGASQMELKGQFAFWRRSVCTTGLDCQIPVTIAPNVTADVIFFVPTKAGSNLVANTSYRSAGAVSGAASGTVADAGSTGATQAASTPEQWTVDLTLVWVNPQPNDPTPAYLVTQIRLSEATLGVVAECSRYDGIENLKFLLPGSCSGRSGEFMYGVSTITLK